MKEAFRFVLPYMLAGTPTLLILTIFRKKILIPLAWKVIPLIRNCYYSYVIVAALLWIHPYATICLTPVLLLLWALYYLHYYTATMIEIIGKRKEWENITGFVIKGEDDHVLHSLLAFYAGAVPVRLVLTFNTGTVFEQITGTALTLALIGLFSMVYPFWVKTIVVSVLKHFVDTVKDIIEAWEDI